MAEKQHFGAVLVALFILYTVPYISCQDTCSFPSYYHGNWYYQDVGSGHNIIINNDVWDGRTCMRIVPINDTTNVNTDKHAKVLMRVSTGGTKYCYTCFYVMWRTPNIIQFRASECNDVQSVSGCGLNRPEPYELVTMYLINPISINCKTTFEGFYRFTYELEEGGGGICTNADNEIQACQLPGSPYVDNQVMYFDYRKCTDVSTSRNQRIRYKCLGSWLAENGYEYAGIALAVEKDLRETYKCLMTKRDQRVVDNKYRWVRSRFSDCRTLQSTYRGYERLVVSPIPPRSVFMTPACNLPRNLTGKWFTMGESDTRVEINETHIYFNKKIDEFNYEESYFSCQQTYGTRYLMTSVTVGRCEVDFVCWDIMPRHHSVVRFRTGRPSRLTRDEETDPNYRIRKFRQTCDWLAFTIDRDQADWKYSVLIQESPSPVPCPIGGRYRFEQYCATEADCITTQIRTGITERPRIQVDCRNVQTEFKSCSHEMTKTNIDAEYCETLDYKGKPIGEYDEPDIVMTCVGYWMEDMKSYLITYDEEDALSNYRCWVYKRLSWTEIEMSRSVRAVCGRHQMSDSYTPDKGASLHLLLKEAERLFDMCPQRFDDGYDPYKKPMTIYVMAGTSSVLASVTVTAISLCLLVLS